MAIKQTIIEESVCDVCGAKADGEYSSSAYLNGEVYYEATCPLDLCKNHMKTFVFNYLYLEYERGESDLEEKRAELLRVLKN